MDTFLTISDLEDLVNLVGAEKDRGNARVEPLLQKLEFFKAAAPIGLTSLAPAPTLLAVDIKTAAQISGVPEKEVRRDLEDGSLIGFTVAEGRQWRVRLKELERYMAKKERLAQRVTPVIVSERNLGNGKFVGKATPMFEANKN